ncbi:BatA and WFA domain-containing protein [Pedobacter sp. ISL-68]|uniref:BatA domain-containing protein n=1 Tax=unclassified Pedobacter TaxID=2628915 RepID=UPI001BE7F89A|nr:MULTISPECIES: BatA domain-containing protein [unclassified Pedobacter]MBT2564066.1 BatA and WFA domain-containing protein [Pedobacter sp. ISL-64]MBT2589800.1 BatA and WFA domain-containing protein [Pedobacter sp. ISL-68]
MNFLYPGFLFALISVAIPVIIHLFNFRKFKKVYFSNVQLLKEVEQQNSSKEKLKNLLILLSRILAIVFLVLAFAQPYIPAHNQKTTALNNVVSIYIDNSYSMEAINKDGNLLDEAKRKAKELVKGFGMNDRFQLLTNNFEGKHQRLLNEEEFLKALDDVKISAANRNLQQILNRQGNVLTGSANKYSFLISDFQKNISTTNKLDTKADIQYSFLKLNANTLPNVAIDSVWALSPNHQPGANERLVVQLKNYSEEEAKNIPLKLSINNQQKGLGAVTIPAGKTVKDTLNFSGLNAGWQKGLISIKDFPVTFDDTLSFSFKVDESFPVLSINGANTGNYIKALFAADRYYKLTENAESNVNYSSFASYGLIVLNGLKNPSTGLAQQLKTYLNAGGTVVLFPDLDANIQTYNSFLSGLSLPAIQGLNTTPSKVDQIDLQNPIFRTVFEEIPKNLDLPTVSRYYSFVEKNTSNKEDVMLLPGRKPFFSKYGVGNGQVYLSASGLNTSDGNLARHPVFVPLIYRLALSGGNETPLYYNLGNDNALAGKKITLGKNQSLKITADGFEAIPEIRQANGKTLIYIADQIKNAGFYNLKLADSLLAVYSFNNGRTESDMHYLSKIELDQLAGKSNLKIFDTDKDAVKLIAGTNKIGQTLWKLCLILSLIFIAAEILLIRFFNNTKKTI